MDTDATMVGSLTLRSFRLARTPACQKLALASILLLTALPGVMRAQRQVEMPVVADAMVQSGIYAADNFGDSDLQVSSRGANFDRRVYLKVDLGDLPAAGEAYLQAALELVVADPPRIGTDTGPALLALYGLAGNDAWQESSVTWNSAPAGASNWGAAPGVGAIRLAEATLTADRVAGSTVRFEGAELAQFLEWARGALGDRYATGRAGTGGGPVTLLVVILGTDATVPGWRFLSRESAVAASRPVVRATVGPAAPPPAPVLENQRYRVALGDNHSITVTELASGVAAVFEPRFQVLSRSTSVTLSSVNITGAAISTGSQLNYNSTSWNGETDLNAVTATRTQPVVTGSVFTGASFRWTFAETSTFAFEAELDLPAGEAEPRLRWTLRPKSTSRYSVGYLGAPAVPTTALDWLWQPPVWYGKRLPNQLYLTDESRTSIPASFVQSGGRTVSVVVDPDEMPFRLPTMSNARFGVTVRSPTATWQPAVYAPLLGGAESNRSTPHTFAVRLFVSAEDILGSFQNLAQGLWQFRDRRQNLPGGSLNTALDNLEDFILNASGQNYSYWSETAKANDYVNDKPGYARFQSAAVALSLAVVRDRNQLYDERAVPSMEYYASRRSNLFKIDGYDPAYTMTGPLGGLITGDWAALEAMSGYRSTPFRRLGNTSFYSSIALRNRIDTNRSYVGNEAIDLGRRWLRHLIYFYRLTGEAELLADARHIADAYIAARLDQPPVNFLDAGSSFWNELCAHHDALFELYELTDDMRYAQAAVRALREFVLLISFGPIPPDGDVTFGSRTAPAWRFSEIGTVSEAAGTSNSHRAIFMPYLASFLVRAAQISGDDFFADLGKANIVGRFLNYPGYTLRTNYSLVFQDATYPLKFYSAYSNTAHMNHPLPMAMMVVDYLVADADRRSGGSIRFPALVSDTGAYFRQRVFGHEAGRFFDDSGVWLWLPRRLLSFSGTGNEQIQYLAGHGNGNLYIALSNQSHALRTVSLTVNPERVTLPATTTARTWIGSNASTNLTVVNGVATVTVPANGLLSLAIAGASPRLEVQADTTAGPHASLPTNSFDQRGSTEQDRQVGMIMSIAPGRQHAYVYLGAPPSVMPSAVLRYQIDGGSWQEQSRGLYPFEWTIPLPANASSFRYQVVGGNGTTGPEVLLSLQTSGSPLLTPGNWRAETVAGGIELRWNPVVGASTYRIERRRLNTAAPTALLPPQSADVSGLRVDGAQFPGTEFAYRIRAEGANGVSAWSDELLIRSDTVREAWRRLYFDTRENVGLAADSADASGNGIANLLEYAFGRRPDVSAGPSPLSFDGQSLGFPWDPAARELKAWVQESGDLQAWQTVATYTEQFGFQGSAPGWQVETSADGQHWWVEVTAPAAGENSFLRLLVQPE
jgi:hypothetical protein